jgi:hypothetical protein
MDNCECDNVCECDNCECDKCKCKCNECDKRDAAKCCNEQDEQIEDKQDEQDEPEFLEHHCDSSYVSDVSDLSDNEEEAENRENLETREGLVEIISPMPLKESCLDNKRTRLFLGGSIENGTAPNWQADLVKSLADLPIYAFNPRRADWNPNAGADEIKKQIEWELEAQANSNICLYYFDESCKSVITLLELGFFSNSIVYCPVGYFRYLNVKCMCDAFGIPCLQSVDELIDVLKNKINSREEISMQDFEAKVLQQLFKMSMENIEAKFEEEVGATKAYRQMRIGSPKQQECVQQECAQQECAQQECAQQKCTYYDESGKDVTSVKKETNLPSELDHIY